MLVWSGHSGQGQGKVGNGIDGHVPDSRALGGEHEHWIVEQGGDGGHER